MTLSCLVPSVFATGHTFGVTVGAVVNVFGNPLVAVFAMRFNYFFFFWVTRFAVTMTIFRVFAGVFFVVFMPVGAMCFLGVWASTFKAHIFGVVFNCS